MNSRLLSAIWYGTLPAHGQVNSFHHFCILLNERLRKSDERTVE